MQRWFRICGYVAAAIVVVFSAPKCIYFISPLLAVVHQWAFGLSAIVCILGLPIVAYLFAVNKRDKCERHVAIALVVFVLCASTEPRVERKHTFTVFGIAGEFSQVPATKEVKCYCLEDAIAVARTLYEDRRKWSRDENGQFEVCDVKIEQFTYTPALEWINSLFGTHYGSIHSDLSIRLLDDGEDPLRIADASRSYEPEP